MNKAIKLILGIVLMTFLVLIRAYASDLFYDPLIVFFKNVRESFSLPDFDWAGLLLHISLRFWINSFISLSILWLIFNNRELIQWSLILFAAFFVLFLIAFIILLKAYQPGAYMSLFYVRRFLIHPILLLILIPGFYFFKNRN